MSETFQSAQSELRHPLRFLSAAVRDLRHCPGIAWQLFRRNLQARYRRSWLSYLWLVLPSIGGTMLWVYLQSRRVVDVGETATPYPVYVLSGTVLWQVFVDALNAPLQQLTAGRQMITRSRVPHEALILAGLFEVGLNAAVRLALLAGAMALFGVGVTPRVFLAPLGLAALVLFGLAVGMFAAPLGMLYDDVQRAMLLITGFWFFLTPVVYPTGDLGLLRFNPVTPLLDTTRGWLTSGRVHDGFAVVTAVTLLALFFAWLLERLARPHVVARLG